MGGEESGKKETPEIMPLCRCWFIFISFAFIFDARIFIRNKCMLGFCL